ncbi:MAG: hypothetical protein HQM10_19575 [Candidatus Riflebacteria bacterium]|nr:hypothetical protein [Candidatus Riflebacteria bacterium]
MHKKFFNIPIIGFILLFLFFTASAKAFDIDEATEIEPLIRNNELLKAFLFSIGKVVLYGFQKDEIDYFLKIYNLFSPKTFLIVQNYEFQKKSKGKRFFHVFAPITKYNQKVLWQTVFFNSKKLSFDTKKKGYFFENTEEAIDLKVCSIVKTWFVQNNKNIFFSAKPVRKSFTTSLSSGLNSLLEIYEFLLRYGTYAANNKVLPIQYILLNPFNIDCTEFSTIVAEILLDKGLNPNYALGLTISNYKKNFFEKHCWINVFFNNQIFDIDVVLSRQMGKAAYGGQLPIRVLFGEVKKLNRLRFFPLEIFDEKNVEITENIEYNENLKAMIFSCFFLH